jgi:fatty acid desaturase
MTVSMSQSSLATSHLSRSHLGKRPDAVSLLVVAAHLALVLAPVYLAAALGPAWWLVGCWLWFGLTMNGLLNLMHEAAHCHVFHERGPNDLLGRWLLGPLALADFDGYRRRHWDHHRRLGEPDDPKTTYHTDIRGWRALALAARCLTLAEAVAKFRHQTESDQSALAPGTSPAWMIRVVLFQSAFAGSLLAFAWSTHRADLRGALLAAALSYGFVYLYGLASVTVFAAGLRAIAEHQPGPDRAAREGAAALRNFHCGAPTRLILGAYGFAEHATHHLQPGIPYYHLPAATRELAAADGAMAPHFGYWSTLWTLARAAAGTSNTARA